MINKSKIGNLLTLKEVADKLKVSKRTVYRLIENGKLKPIRLSVGNFRILEEDLIRFINKNRK